MWMAEYESSKEKNKKLSIPDFLFYFFTTTTPEHTNHREQDKNQRLIQQGNSFSLIHIYHLIFIKNNQRTISSALLNRPSLTFRPKS